MILPNEMMILKLLLTFSYIHYVLAYSNVEFISVWQKNHF